MVEAVGVPLPSKLITAGIIVVIAGIVLILAGILYLIIKAHGKAEYGGVVVIGPLPIVFGSSSDAVKVAVIGAIALMILAIVVMFLPLILVKSKPP